MMGSFQLPEAIDYQACSFTRFKKKSIADNLPKKVSLVPSHARLYITSLPGRARGVYVRWMIPPLRPHGRYGAIGEFTMEHQE
jgi:hypothetical protein